MLTQISVKSPRLQRLMDDFTNQTGRRIEFEVHATKTTDDYIAHCDISSNDKIIITLDLERLGIGNDLESIICHEFFHAALMLQQGFYVYATKEQILDRFVTSMVTDIESAIQDLAVYRRMHDIGMPPFRKKDLEKLKERSESIKSSQGLPSGLPMLSFRRIVLISVTFRMGLRILKLGKRQNDVIHRFAKTIKRWAPNLYNESQKIIDILLNYEILSPDGNRDAIEAVFEHWGLEHEHTWLRYDHQSGSLQPLS